jgi:hypothetical protein
VDGTRQRPDGPGTTPRPGRRGRLRPAGPYRPAGGHPLPGHRVGGFVLPVINLWWPYQSTCDLLPPGDGRRSLVLRWFLLWIGGGFLGSIFSFASLLLHGWEGWLLLMAPAVLTTLAALSARQVIAEVLASHEALART